MNVQSSPLDNLTDTNHYLLKVVLEDGKKAFELTNNSGASDTHGTYHFPHVHMASYHVGGNISIMRGNEEISKSTVLPDEKRNLFPSARWLSTEFTRTPHGSQEMHADDFEIGDVMIIEIPSQRDNWLACVVAYQEYCEKHGIESPTGVTYPSFSPLGSS